MRLFIAVPVPEEVKEELKLLQTALQVSRADVRWVPPQNFHITLKFLGDIELDKKEALNEALAALCREEALFEARLAALGTFPEGNRPQVVWVGIDRGKEAWKHLAAKAESALTAVGMAPNDKPFSSHLTVGRVRSGKNLKKLSEHLKKTVYKSKAPFAVDRITLFKSTLSREGAVYEALKDFKLKAPARK